MKLSVEELKNIVDMKCCLCNRELTANNISKLVVYYDKNGRSKRELVCHDCFIKYEL